MPGSIQSIERAAAMLRVLGTADEPLALGEVAGALSLPKATTHGILRTLREVGFVDRDPATGRYALGDGLQRLGTVRVDAQELRSLAMNWADELAARTGLSVLVGHLRHGDVQVAHHVFRPDGSPQRLRVGELLPAHATALGKVLLAHAPTTGTGQRNLPRYTSRTLTAQSQLLEALADARQDGYAHETGEHAPDQASVAAPVRGTGGLVVGAVAVLGPLERVLDGGHRPRRTVVDGTVRAARAISDAIGDPR